MWILLFAASLALAAARPLPAQFPTDISVGSRVRVVLPDSVRQSSGPWRQQWLRGDVAALAGDTLYLRLQGTAAPVPIRRPAIRRIDRSLGVPTPLESALQGAVGWALPGAALGFATGWPDVRRDNGRNNGDAALRGAAWGAGIGFILGAIFPTERWRRVRLR
jgi:hypothetical protein